MAARYLALIRHDLEVLRLLSEAARIEKPPADVSDWKCTILYYMACIYVKALGVTRGKEIQDHFQLKQWMNTTQDLISITRSYRKLEERSRDARYEGRKFTEHELSEALRWFGEVRDLIATLLQAASVPDVPRVDARQYVRS